MRTHNDTANAPPISSKISDPAISPLQTSSGNLNRTISASDSSTSFSEAESHDEGTTKHSTVTASATASDTSPGVGDGAPTPQSEQPRTSTDASADTTVPTTPKKPLRPRLSSRRSSGTIIIPRDSAVVEVDAEVYDEGDARAMSPPRSTEEVEKMTEEARAALTEQAKTLQSHIGDLADRVETVKSEHDKLETGNKFLQSYIGQLMHSTKITASGAGRSSKGKSRVT